MSSADPNREATVQEPKGFTAVCLEPVVAKAALWVEAMGRVNRYVMSDLGGGRRVLKLAWVINFQKLTTIPLLGFFIGWYHNTSPEAWIYFAMQSSYGLAWMVKDLAFPDSNFHKRITIGAGIASFLTVLGWYWLFGWLLISAGALPAYRCRTTLGSAYASAYAFWGA